jgi:hypothetical protein
LGDIPISSQMPRMREARLRVTRRGTLAKSPRDTMRLFRCHSCGEVIGVYEPLVVHRGSRARTTSLAAEPELERTSALHYHQACYTALLTRD